MHDFGLTHDEHLIFSDWLQDQGESIAAEQIRHRCEKMPWAWVGWSSRSWLKLTSRSVSLAGARHGPRSRSASSSGVPSVLRARSVSRSCKGSKAELVWAELVWKRSVSRSSSGPKTRSMSGSVYKSRPTIQ